MKFILACLLSLVLSLGMSQTTCDSLTYKIMMVGDSWSRFPVNFGSFPNNLDRYGYTNVGMFSNTSDLSVNGAVTSDFLTPAGNTAIQNGLNSNPNIEIVNLSIGGNDLLGSWNKSMDSLTTDSIIEATMGRVDSIIKNIKAMKPSIIIYLSGYDFPNFAEEIMTFIAPTSHFFYNTWNNMGQPSFIEINTLLTRSSEKFKILADTQVNVSYNNPIGLMQYTYGQTTPLGVAPSGTYLPKSVPFPGGRLDYPSPRSSMNNYGLFRDCFHLNSEGFDVFYNYHFENYYWNYLRGDVDSTYTSEGGNNDGGVTSMASLSASNVTVGNSTASGISKGIVSFNTASLPSSTQLHKANIFLYRDNHTGALPSFNKVILEVKKGNFGTSTGLDLNDYTSAADKKDTACTYGTVKENGFWLRISVPSTLLTEINTSGKTQFRISMIDSTDGSTFFFSTGDSANKPFLDLEFFNPASIDESYKDELVYLFPNPTNEGIITVKNLVDFKGKVTAIDMTGRQVPIIYSNSQLNVSELSKGSYFLIFRDSKQQFAKRFVKL